MAHYKTKDEITASIIFEQLLLNLFMCVNLPGSGKVPLGKHILIVPCQSHGQLGDILGEGK